MPKPRVLHACSRPQAAGGTAGVLCCPPGGTEEPVQQGRGAGECGWAGL